MDIMYKTMIHRVQENTDLNFSTADRPGFHSSSVLRSVGCKFLKGNVQPFEFVGVTGAHLIRHCKLESWYDFFFFLIFMLQSHKRSLKQFGLRITGMALSNQSQLPGFFSPGQVNLKISHLILPNRTIP
jgi:hypothetical protein